MPEIGSSKPRLDAIGKVTGETAYPGDLVHPDMAFMKILFAERPHAWVIRIDTSKAKALEGVLAVFTAKDVPVNEYGLIMPDQPVLCGPGSEKPYADHVRFVGDQLALVVAETEDIAEHASRLIEVEYEDLPIVTDPVRAMQSDSMKLHPERDDNIFCHYKIRKGDVDEGFSKAAVIIEGEYHTPAQEHAYLQPEAGLAYIDEQGRVTVEVAGQWTHEDQEQIAHSLNLPLDQVRVIYPAIGGAFGGREDMSVQIVLALATWRLHQEGIKRAVKIIWSREESILGHHKRHPFVLREKWGADEEGKILAAEMEIIQDGGAYAYTSTKVLGNAILMSTGPYEIPNVKADAYSVYTNNIPGGAFRGFGGPQASFAAECQISKLAEALGLDPVEIRSRNLLQEGSKLAVDSPLPEGVSIEQVVEETAIRAGWKHSKGEWRRPELDEGVEGHLKRGVGFACGFKNVGFSFGAPEQCTATIELRGGVEIEEVLLFHAGADVGQGAHTVMVQMAAEAVGVPAGKVQIIASDTATSGNSGSASASRLTFMSGNAIQGAAEAALVKWRGEERPVKATYQYRPPPTTPLDPETGRSAAPNFSYGYVAQAVAVEVDTELGTVRIIDVFSGHDVGKALNPQQVEGQIEGAVVQAAGYALMEDFQQQDGYVQTSLFSTYLIPTVLDIPERVESLILEVPDPIGPWGARGMAEMPYIPLTPAIIAAVHDATGVWFDRFPLTSERVLRGMGLIDA